MTLPSWVVWIITCAVALMGVVGILSACLWLMATWMRSILLALGLWDSFFRWWWSEGQAKRKRKSEQQQ